MPDSGAHPTDAIVVGSRVRVLRAPGSQFGDIPPEVGVVVEDFAEAVIDNAELGRDWALVRRWAIALDSGRLVFAEEGGLELA